MRAERAKVGDGALGGDPPRLRHLFLGAACGMIDGIVGAAERPARWGIVMLIRLYRPLVVWLLVVIIWGVYRGLAATDDSIVVHLIRDAAGVGIFALPVGCLLWLVADSFDVHLK